MGRFRDGDLDVLVATTVIEVGVDVPNATVMVVLDADRFGIAQLHQLRGRVGRGADASTCWLVTGEPEPRATEPTPAGRGAGGHDQRVRAGRGRPRAAGRGHDHEHRPRRVATTCKLASLRRDRELVELAREAAFAIVDADPEPRRQPAPARRARAPPDPRGHRVPDAELSSDDAEARSAGLRLLRPIGHSSSSSRTRSQRSRQSSQR